MHQSLMLVQSLVLVLVLMLVQSLMLRMHQRPMLVHGQSLVQTLVKSLQSPQGLQHHVCESLSQDQKRLTQVQRLMQSLVLVLGPLLVQSLMLRMHLSLMMQIVQGLQHHVCESLSQNQKRLTQVQTLVQSLVKR
jgi:hypothetical protein